MERERAIPRKRHTNNEGQQQEQAHPSEHAPDHGCGALTGAPSLMTHTHANTHTHTESVCVCVKVSEREEKRATKDKDTHQQ